MNLSLVPHSNVRGVRSVSPAEPHPVSQDDNDISPLHGGTVRGNVLNVLKAFEVSSAPEVYPSPF